MQTRIPKPFIQDVVARTDIVAIIQSRIELKKRGHTHVACCPFHAEKTPSFTVSQSKQFYYCFGCGAHGNVIGFLMEYDPSSFVDAVTDLATQLGMPIPLEANDANTAQNDILYTLLYNAQVLYEKQLKQSNTAIQYLKDRGLTGKIAKAFGIGYAPNAWEFLSNALGKNKSDREALILAGMLIEKQNRHYDRFRDRILFPIRDIRGKTIGFGGRTLTSEIPKYLNSPETPVFHKNQTLYGLYETCQQHRKLQRVLVVEGYLDVISLAQHGITYAVATLGTALNAKHIQLLLRYTSDIIFCFDGDAAGQKAAWKALTFSLPLLRDGLNIRFLLLDQLATRLHIARADLAELSMKKNDVGTPPMVTPARRSYTRLNPVQSAIQLLLTHPALAASAAQVPAFAFSEKTAEKMLLLDLIQRCTINPTVHVGDLLEAIEDDVQRALLAKIAALPMHIPEEGRSAEFIGALRCLHEQDQAHQLSHLIAKAKQNGLDAEEKQLLQLLLAKKHATTIADQSLSL